MADMGQRACRTPEAKAVPYLGLYGQGNVLERREGGENTGDLEGMCQSQSGAPGHRQRCDIASREVNMSSLRAHLAGQLANEGRLASTVGTDDGMEFTGHDDQVKGSGGNHGAKVFYQVPYLKKGLGHGWTSSA